MYDPTDEAAAEPHDCRLATAGVDASSELGLKQMDFIQARHWQWADRDAIRLIVVHTMESPEKPGTARAVAKWFAGATAPMASAHVCVDNVEQIECVKPQHIAFGAPGANRDGYQIEHAGRAAQSALDWQDPFSVAMLVLSARQAASIAHRYIIPATKLGAAELLAGAHGFCGHVDVTQAYHKSTHTDPGPHFPWEQYLALVARETELLEQDTDPALV